MNYGINLDLQLRGQEKFARAIRQVEQLESALKRVKQEIDLSAKLPGTGGQADKIGTTLKKLNETAAKIAETGKVTKKTQAGVADLIGAFKQLSASADTTKLSFKNFVEATVVAEKELNKLARAEENVRREFLGMQSLEQREAQLERRANTLRVLRTRRKLKQEEADARERNARAIRKEQRELLRKAKADEREAAIQERQRKERRRRKFTDVATGVGFPLLFGGGPGSAIGGLVGGALGGLGGSVLGSALGQQFDKVGQAALNTAKAFEKLGATASDLIAPLGRGAGGGFGAQAEFLIGQGRSSQVAEILRTRFDEVYGEGATAKFDELARVGKELEGTFQEIGIALQTLMMGPLKEFLKALQGFTPAAREDQARATEQRQRIQRLSQLDDIEKNKGGLTITERLERESLMSQVELAIKRNQVELEGGSARLRMEGLIKQEKKEAEKIAKLTVEIEQVALTARRDTLATMRGTLQVTTAELELNRIQAQLTAERKKDKQDILRIAQLESEELNAQTALDVAKAARDNARIQAERQIIKEQIAGAGTRIQLINESSNLQLKFLQNEEGRFNLVAEEFQMIRHNLDINKGLLELQRKSALIGVNELERVSAINREYDLRGDLLERQAELQAQALIQAKAAHDVARMQVAQTREMETLTARMNAQQQIAATSPFENAGFLADPFFGDSNQLEAEQALNYANTLEQLNKQLDQVTARRLAAADASPQLRQSLEDEQAALRNQIANYKEYQPAINEAALAQARFNDALKITAPVTNSVFDSLMAVVEGTKTAEQAFADFLRTIADMLIKAAAQMIATYIAIGVARMFAGVPSGSEASGTDKHIADVSSAMKQYNFDFGGGMASGGRVSGGTSYLVGEKGPELFTPGASGTITPNHAMGGVEVGSINITVENTGEQLSPAAQKQIANQVQGIVMSTLVNERRSGGVLR